MANYFVLAGSDKANHYQVAVHVDVPAGNNQAAKTWQSVAVEYQESTVSAVPWIDGATQTALDTGALYEFVIDVEVDADETDANKIVAVETAVTTARTDELARLQVLLRYWGYEGTVT